jgi:beta-phosphoglucomutase-like phosphatase (HAD superfamily)
VLKAVIFDVDGTLIDSVDLQAQSWVRTFSDFGVHAKFADVRSHYRRRCGCAQQARRALWAVGGQFGLSENKRRKLW